MPPGTPGCCPWTLYPALCLGGRRPWTTPMWAPTPAGNWLGSAMGGTNQCLGQGIPRWCRYFFLTPSWLRCQVSRATALGRWPWQLSPTGPDLSGSGDAGCSSYASGSKGGGGLPVLRASRCFTIPVCPPRHAHTSINSAFIKCLHLKDLQ